MDRNEAYDVAKIFDDLELELIKKLNEKFGDIENIDPNQWQNLKLQQLKSFRNSSSKVINNYVKSYKRNFKQLTLKDYISGILSAEHKQKSAMRKGFKPKRIAPPINMQSLNERKLTALFNAIDHDMDIVSYAIKRQSDDVYRRTVFNTLTEFNTGTYTLSQSIDRATQDFLEQGINYVRYKNGRKVNTASYAEMYLRTASSRAFLQGEGDRRKEWGESLVIISSKSVACPKCLRWLGRVCIDDVYSGGKRGDYRKDYPLMSQAIAEGFLHPNCQDTFTGYYEGINEPERIMTDDEKLEASRIYNLQQQQRSNERDIRKYKRLEAGSLSPGNKHKYSKLVKQSQATQRDLISGNKELQRDYKREKLY